MGQNIIICGQPDHGKDFFIKTVLLKGKQVSSVKGKDVIFTEKSPSIKYCNILDITKEYSFFFQQYIPLPDFTDYKNIMLENTKNKVPRLNIVNEGTSFLGHRSIDMKMNFVLTQRFHSNNSFIFCFHAVRKIPAGILDVADILILFKTGMGEKSFIEDKYKNEEIIKSAFYKVYNSENKYAHIAIDLLRGKFIEIT